VVYDTAAPTGSLSLGKTATNLASNTLTISASDATSGVTYMQLSNDGTNWTGLLSYATSYSWDITSATYGGTTTEANKQVRIRFRDRAGNTSSTILSAAVYYDVTAPTVGTLTPSSTAPGYRAITVTSSASDSGSGIKQVQFCVFDGISTYYYKDWENWTGTGTNYSVLLPQQNIAKRIYARYVDNAGNYTTWAVNSAVTLAQTYGTLSRAQIAAANYGQTGDYLDYINVSNLSSYSNYVALDSSHNSSIHPWVFVSSSGQVGKFYYAWSGNTIYFYYTTFDSAGTVVVASSVTLTIASGSAYFVNLDAASNYSATYSTASGHDIKITYDTTNGFRLYPTCHYTSFGKLGLWTSDSRVVFY
jgi:hypothetical protein